MFNYHSSFKKIAYKQVGSFDRADSLASMFVVYLSTFVSYTPSYTLAIAIALAICLAK